MGWHYMLENITGKLSQRKPNRSFTNISYYIKTFIQLRFATSEYIDAPSCDQALKESNLPLPLSSSPPLSPMGGTTLGAVT